MMMASAWAPFYLALFFDDSFRLLHYYPNECLLGVIANEDRMEAVSRVERSSVKCTHPTHR
jgi:hypothetical protein